MYEILRISIVSTGKIPSVMAITQHPPFINTSNSGVLIICLKNYIAVVYVYIQNINEFAGNISLLILRLSKPIEAERRLDQIQPIAGGMGQKSIR